MADGTEHAGDGRISRRELVKRAGVGAGGLVLSGAAAGPAWARPKAHDASSTIKIGFVSPRTGPASGFGEPDGYVLGLARKAFATGITVAGKHYSVQVIDKDGQSTPSRGAQVASDLIHGSNVDLMLTTSTPETTLPVATVCEKLHTPCLSTVVPWEAWYAGLGGNPLSPISS